MRRKLAALTLLYLFATAQMAAAASVPVTRETQKDVMVTIYNGNLGLVKDLREVRLPAGVHEVQFMDVAAQIDPTTVHLKSLTDRRRTQDPRAELRVRPALEREAPGEVRRPQGPALRQATAPSTRPRCSRPTGRSTRSTARSTSATTGGSSCPPLPENLVAKPTLVWLLRNQTERPQRVEASYLTGGHHLEGRLRHGAQRRRHARPTSPAG